MRLLILIALAAFTGKLTQLANAQTRSLSVCDALTSGVDHQVVVIHAAIALYRHGTYIFEGTGQDPCPGWRKQFFTAPASIPLAIASYPGVSVPTNIFRDNADILSRIRNRQQANSIARFMVTVRGVLIRKSLPLIFRRLDGKYVGFAEGIDGTSAALLVATSVLVEDR